MNFELNFASVKKFGIFQLHVLLHLNDIACCLTQRQHRKFDIFMFLPVKLYKELHGPFKINPKSNVFHLLSFLVNIRRENWFQDSKFVVWWYSRIIPTYHAHIQGFNSHCEHCKRYSLEPATYWNTIIGMMSSF